jgi:nucleoside-diphosphate-sugar epimerase
MLSGLAAMNYFVTGGSGFVGRHLLLRLLAEGHTVRALARSEDSAIVVEALGATAVRADLPDVGDVTDEIRGCDVVVHAAADTRQWGRAGDFDRVNVTGTRRLLEAARNAGVQRFVHVSTEAVLADGNPIRFVDESAPYPKRHAGDYARTKALAEQLVLAADSRELRTVAVRPRLVWGPGDTTVLPQILQAVQDERWAWVHGGHYLTSTCHVLNLCAGILAAADQGTGGRAYFLTDGAPVEFRSFITRCAAAYGVTMPDRTVPYALARTAAVVLDRGWRVLRLKGEPPVSAAAMALGGHEVTVNDGRARAEIGYAPVITVDEGIDDLAATSERRG